MLFAEFMVVGAGKAVGFVADPLEEVEDGGVAALEVDCPSAFSKKDFFPFCERRHVQSRIMNRES